MRHGHHTLVEGNYFLGNRKPNTGGIRIINEYQTVKKNYMWGLTGHRFRGALVIMNGVPNSPLNRYNQVIDSYMDNNIVLNSDYIQLCAGSDEERSAIPQGSTFRNNLILGKYNLNPFTIYDDISGITFSGNMISDNLSVPIQKGFEKTPLALETNKHNLLAPAEELIAKLDFGKVALPITKAEVGASYYPKEVRDQNTKRINVKAETNALLEAVKTSAAGDTLILENGSTYLLTKYAYITHPLIILTPQGQKATILSEKQSFFKIENGGALQVKNIVFDGSQSPDQAGNNIIATSKYSMNKNYAPGGR